MAQPISLPDCAQQLLSHIYPSVDFSRVEFFRGLPWFTSIFSPGTGAIVLPAPSGTTNFHVYLSSSFNFCDHIRTLVHEVYHLAQFMSIDNGIGYIFRKKAYVEYFKCYYIHGYYDNPFEKVAFDFEDTVGTRADVCDCSDPRGLVTTKTGALAEALADQTLVVARPEIGNCTGAEATLFATFLTTIMSGPYALASQLNGITMRDCRAIVVKQKRCCKKIETVTEECAKHADQGYDECSEWADEGYNTCSQFESKCCDWPPCSWICNLLVVFCKVYVWVANLVCKAWVWISNVVCVAWNYFTSVTCSVWLTLVRIVWWCK